MPSPCSSGLGLFYSCGIQKCLVSAMTNVVKEQVVEKLFCYDESALNNDLRETNKLKQKMKYGLIFFAAILVLFSLAGCSGKDNSSNNSAASGSS